jgi:hypothetical protein
LLSNAKKTKLTNCNFQKSWKRVRVAEMKKSKAAQGENGFSGAYGY